MGSPTSDVGGLLVTYGFGAKGLYLIFLVAKEEEEGERRKCTQRLFREESKRWAYLKTLHYRHWVTMVQHSKRER